MRIHLTADHGGYELAQHFRAKLADVGHEVVWHGPDQLDPGDDFPAFVVRAAKAVVVDQDASADAFAIAFVGTPAAGLIAANKVNGARAVHTHSPAEVIRLRKALDANVLVIDGGAYEVAAWLTIAAFIRTPLDHDVDMGRRVLQLEEFENSGTIEGWAVQLEPEQIARNFD